MGRMTSSASAQRPAAGIGWGSPGGIVGTVVAGVIGALLLFVALVRVVNRDFAS